MTAADQPPPPDTPIVGQVDLIPPGVDGSALGLGQVLRQGEALRLRLVAEGLELGEEVVTEEPRAPPGVAVVLEGPLEDAAP
jgi:hypothetical protein